MSLWNAPTHQIAERTILAPNARRVATPPATGRRRGHPSSQPSAARAIAKQDPSKASELLGKIETRSAEILTRIAARRERAK